MISLPNFAAFNSNPDELRVLIYGRDGDNNVAIRTDSAGNIGAEIVGGAISATITAGTLSSVETVDTLIDGTISSVLGATITAGTLSSVETVDTLLDGTISSVLGATITAGTLSSVETVDTLIDGTISSVLGATITAGTLSSVETVDTLLDGTISSVLGATITAGTLTSVVSISQKSFVEEVIADLATSDTFVGTSPIDTSSLGTYSFFIHNKGVDGNSADARVEISADGTNWYVDTSAMTGIAAGSVDVLVPLRFMRYTRVAYRSSVPGNPTTLDIYFNGQGT